MPTYVMLTTLGPDGWATVRENPERIREVTREVESMGLKVVAQYGLLGQWDFLNVIEAPDEASVARRDLARVAGNDAHDDAAGRPDRRPRRPPPRRYPKKEASVPWCVYEPVFVVQIRT